MTCRPIAKPIGPWPSEIAVPHFAVVDLRDQVSRRLDERQHPGEFLTGKD
jgi:hypothetical protein